MARLFMKESTRQNPIPSNTTIAMSIELRYVMSTLPRDLKAFSDMTNTLYSPTNRLLEGPR